jgi:hypothetical protein
MNALHHSSDVGTVAAHAPLHSSDVGTVRVRTTSAAHYGAALAAFSDLHGIENANVAPGPSFDTAHRRPRWLSMMERLTDNPIPSYLGCVAAAPDSRKREQAHQIAHASLKTLDFLSGIFDGCFHIKPLSIDPSIAGLSARNAHALTLPAGQIRSMAWPALNGGAPALNGGAPLTGSCNAMPTNTRRRANRSTASCVRSAPATHRPTSGR